AAEPLRLEPALRRPAAEIARADFPDDVAAPRAVMAADPALARVMGETALPRAPVQREDRIGRKGTEAHRRNVVDRGVIGLEAVRPTDAGAEVGILDLHRHDRMGEPFVAGVVDALARAEGPLVLHPLGALVDERAVVARKRLLVLVAFNQVLANLRPDALEEKAHVADEGVVPENRVPMLEEVVGPEQ